LLSPAFAAIDYQYNTPLADYASRLVILLLIDAAGFINATATPEGYGHCRYWLAIAALPMPPAATMMPSLLAIDAAG